MTTCRALLVTVESGFSTEQNRYLFQYSRTTLARVAVQMSWPP